MSSDDGDKPPSPSHQLYPSPSFSRASPCLPVNSAAGGRNPRCARCSNHGLSVPLKGHKAYCSYRRCECKNCQLVVIRRTVMAQQVAHRRKQELDRHRQQQQHVMVMSKRRRMTSHNDATEPEHSEMLQSSLVADSGDLGGIGPSEALSPSDDEVSAVNQGPSTGAVSSSSTNDAGSLSTLAMIILNYNKNDARLAIDNVRQVAAELTVLLRNEKSVPCNLDALSSSLQVTAAGPRVTYPAEQTPPSRSSPPSTAPSIFAPSVPRTQTTVPTPFELFQPYITARSLPPPPPVPQTPGFRRLVTTAEAALLPGRLAPSPGVVPPPLHPRYLPPFGAGPAAAAAAAAIWTKHWQKSHESTTTTLIHPFAAASALW